MTVMPTSNPRLTITLDRHSYEVLSRLSAATHQSKAAIVVDILSLAIPSLERVTVIMERAQTAPQEVRDGIAAAIERAERDYLPVLQEAARSVDLFIGQAETSAGVRDSTPGM